MIKVLNIIGARPQIIKSAAISRVIRNSFSDSIEEEILHTGQHYDNKMSEVFFTEMEIPPPKYNLNVGSDSHGRQTAKMIIGIEEILMESRPDYVIIYGDTNSTLAASVSASKLQIPIVHIEAGMRSFNKSMPEEINRIVCDHVSTLLFSPTKTGITNLKNEGFSLSSKMPFDMDNPGVYHCGDIMYDNAMYFKNSLQKNYELVPGLNLKEEDFILMTLHRPANTDYTDRMNSIFSAINRLSLSYKTHIILPLHPRTVNILDESIENQLMKQIHKNEFIHIIDPASYLEMIYLESNASMVITDSGGVQKEAYYFKKPCIILRAETEWTELVELKAAILVDANEQEIYSAYKYFSSSNSIQDTDLFGDGKAAEYICTLLVENYKAINANNSY